MNDKIKKAFEALFRKCDESDTQQKLKMIDFAELELRVALKAYKASHPEAKEWDETIPLTMPQRDTVKAWKFGKLYGMHLH